MDVVGSILLEPLQFPFMVNAMVAVVLTSLVCALLSCWLVLIGWSLLGDAVAHSVLPGVVLAYIVGVPFVVGALVFGLIAVTLIGFVRSNRVIKEDAAIGIVFTTLFALGIVLVSVTPSNTDLNHIVFGNVLGVTRADLVQIVGLSVIVMLVLLVTRRELTLFAFDRRLVSTLGLRPLLPTVILLGSLALTAVATLQIVGVVLVVALLIIPGATARLLTDRFTTMMWIAPSIAVVCSITGLYLSYYVNIASGGAVVLVHGIAFLIAFASAPRHGVIARIRRRRVAVSR